MAGPTSQWAVKVGHCECAAPVAREAEVLARTVERPAPLAYSKRARWGRPTGAAWLMTPWMTGPPLWEAFEPVRAGEQHRGALARAVRACIAVGDLHRAGWVHGNLQPHHVIVTARGCLLLDCAWAWSTDLPPSGAFGGGLVHLMSRELMAYVDSAMRPVKPSRPGSLP
ncbi:hypothetical protein [Streptomyces spectabilis]|uniref:Protein kinase domain-containing protein n=1 Tax=Streptomyces spectabilis TaxID=68270 RepID=A0A7W8B3D8_STRST|nr:hypothetical protein [Streptomyces spectabilis]MBB5108951.1 hypothetical protein [Streptomyces spectabilis]GGV50351.1 hypothetical protein GCM10010245_79220 [Streptomyces spectabilis]